MKSYLGPRGYTIHKDSLSTSQYETIKSDLTVQPFVPPVGVGRPAFPIYRESNTKIYLPRHYGLDTFGIPTNPSRLYQGTSIDVPFVGDLRPEQVPVTTAFFANIENGGSGGLLSLPCAFGKTCLSLFILSKLKLKTMIVVHKGFLADQWVERIGQFLPNARVGRLQAQTVDIDDKDIVIAMLQSLSMKDYPESLFESFGFLVVDEVHHISSEVFSCALFRFVTRYTLGLSATMNRKDGTSSVFKLFLGNILFEGRRSENHAVEVRVIQYETKDLMFENVETDMRGNVKYSTMITKLCSYTPRTRFLVKLIHDIMLEETAKPKQLMILAHNRSLLDELYTMIQSLKKLSVGYYVGGMKEAALKESETKQVIVATYSMASEALDIRTLSILVMATPKTDIEQAVGRILRVKHGSPVVVDIVDPHSPFRNQYEKRRQFYKKNNYRIITTTSKEYTPDLSTWRVVREFSVDSTTAIECVKSKKWMGPPIIDEADAEI